MLENLNLTYVSVVLVCLLIAMATHEFMHAFVSHKLGDNTALDEGRLSLNPLRHVDPIMTVLLPAITLLVFHVPIMAAKPVPFNPNRVKYGEYGAAMVAAAGPFTNLLLAFLGAAFVQLLTPGSFIMAALEVFIQLNVALFVFNLIPIPPLDGSRVLYAFAPKPVQDFMEQIEPYGFFIIFALVLMPGFGLGELIYNLNAYVLNLLP